MEGVDKFLEGRRSNVNEIINLKPELGEKYD